VRLTRSTWLIVGLAALFLANGFLEGRGISLLDLWPRDASVAASLQDVISQKSSDVQVRGEGVVVSVLSDDLKGSRHQRFILRIDSGQTLLIAHNIDLAPGISRLKAGDRVEFFGVYEWNSKGGVVHWTHHDPDGSHTSGWLKHDGKTYQ
jgi:hypothetical protein